MNENSRTLRLIGGYSRIVKLIHKYGSLSAVFAFESQRFQSFTNFRRLVGAGKGM